MKNWLKFYFLGFFRDKYGKEAAKRSFFNVILSIALVVVLISGGITAGYAMSFRTHYNHADDFREFLYAAFASDADTRINLTMQNGKLSASIPEAERINGFLEDGEYCVNGYKLIVDTNAAETSFDDFTLQCKDANGIEITYEQYRNLPEQGKKNGSVKFVYSGKLLDVTARQEEYRAYLDKVSDANDSAYNSETAKTYNALKNKKIAGEISDEDFAVKIYTLYAKSYYPSYSKIELYGDAPTLRTYYTQAELIEKENKYLILLDDTFICAFTTEDGMTVNFASYYMGVPDFVVSDDGMSADAMQKNVDKLVRKCFNGSGGLIFFVYVINTGNWLLLLVLIMLVLALIGFLISKFMHLNNGVNYFVALKIVGAYLLFSAIFAFILAIILSFFYVRATVFTATEIAFLCIFALRTVAFFITEIARSKRRPPETPDAQADNTQPSEPTTEEGVQQ